MGDGMRNIVELVRQHNSDTALNHTAGASTSYSSLHPEPTNNPLYEDHVRSSIDECSLELDHEPTLSKRSLIEEKVPEVSRVRWGSRLMFILSAMGAAVGLGNIWRFPYLVYTHGGGVFLLPYVGALALFGLPLLLLEFSLGQQTQKAAMQALCAVHPRAGGVGFASALGAYFMSIYYSVLISWTWLFLFRSFEDPLPWKGSISDAEAFFYREMLGSCFPASSCTLGTSGKTSLQFGPTMANALNWFMTFVCVSRGAKSIGPASLVLMPMPFAMLGILFLRALALEGAGTGIGFYLTPDFSALADPHLWVNALSQIFFSLSLAVGAMIAYGSYNTQESDVVRSALVVGCCNSACSIFAGFVVFAVIGHLAFEEGKAVADVATGGTGLAFVVFPAALALLPASQVFSVIFFLTLLALGLGSAAALVESFKAVLFEMYPELAQRKYLTSAALCFVGWLIGLCMTTSDGRFFLDIFDHFIAQYVLVPIGLLEVVLVIRYYGVDRMANEILVHTEKAAPGVWAHLVKYVIPPGVGVLLVYNVVDEANSAYGGYVWWGILCGWVMVCCIAASLVYFVFFPAKSSSEAAPGLVNESPPQSPCDPLDGTSASPPVEG
eukprot:CAMPEP_0118950024 /NCGR_PEP_ID=MMETSP1169-20130426/50656_1 /TAXON_ID=36882 /ORGANISM="Pyramimonas obovata, Strain CCMP722" /LENGTH=609 /DNA_ID=CAMNT_0006896781 /DNA_START=1556 /DNA_END=3385 /DNA_ORIENTATION=-